MFERQRKQLNKLNKTSKTETFVVKLIYIILFVMFNIFEAWLVYVIGKYSDKVFETILIVLFFVLNKDAYGEPLHFKRNIVCLNVSLILFYISIKSSIPIGISIFASVIIGAFVGCSTSYIATYLYDDDRKYLNKNKVIEILNNNVDEEYIEEICKRNGYKSFMSETIYLYLNNTRKEVCEILNIGETTLNYRINKFIKDTKN